MSNLETEPTDMRTCSRCEGAYSPTELRVTCGHYFDHPYRYIDGVDAYCVACWLVVGRLDREGEAESTNYP